MPCPWLARFVCTNKRHIHLHNPIKTGHVRKAAGGYLGELRSPLLNAVFHPSHHCIKDLLLTSDIQFITRYDVNELIGWEQHELLTLHHLHRDTREQSCGKLWEAPEACGEIQGNDFAFTNRKKRAGTLEVQVLQRYTELHFINDINPC